MMMIVMMMIVMMMMILMVMTDDDDLVDPDLCLVVYVLSTSYSVCEPLMRAIYRKSEGKNSKNHGGKSTINFFMNFVIQQPVFP